MYLIDKAFAYLESEGEHGHHTGYDDGQRASESLKKDMSSFYALHTLNQCLRIGTTFYFKITQNFPISDECETLPAKVLALLSIRTG